MMPESELDVLKTYFQSKHAHVSNYWLQCCVDWFKESNNNYTQQSMCEQIFYQWLLADLRDIEVGCLPAGLYKEKKLNLNGSYTLQLMYLKDISKSSLSQLRKIRDMYKLTRSVTDVEDEPVGKRVLYLTLTDGVKEIKAFEHETVRCLNINLSPGVKLLFTGPLLVRNGEVLLKNNNVKVLGGEVEELLIPNALENVLARELNLPENPKPGKIDAEFLEGNVDFDTRSNIQNLHMNYDNGFSNFSNSNQRNNANTRNTNESNHINSRNPHNLNQFNQKSNVNTNNVIVINSDEEDYVAEEESNLVTLVTEHHDDLDDIFDNIDIDAQLDQIEQNASFHENMESNVEDEFLNIDVSNLEQNQADHSNLVTYPNNDSGFLKINVSNNKGSNVATPSKPAPNLGKLFANVNDEMNVSNSKEKGVTTPNKSAPNLKKLFANMNDSPKQSTSYSDSDFLNVNVSNFEDSVSNSRHSASNSQSSLNLDYDIQQNGASGALQDSSPNIKPVTNTEPYVYIKQLLDNRHKISADMKFKLKAQFLRVVEKLTVKKSRGWAMKFEISDGTGKMSVDFASDVIEELMGLSPAEAIAEKNNVKNKSMVTFEKITEALNCCKKKLHAFDGIMTVKYSDSNTIATIMKLENITNEHLHQLKHRVENASVL